MEKFDFEKAVKEFIGRPFHSLCKSKKVTKTFQSTLT